MFNPPRPRARLDLVELGPKVVPAAAFTFMDLDGDGTEDDVLIVGDARNSTISVLDSGTSYVVSIDWNSDGRLDVDPAEATAEIDSDSFVVEARLGGGNDKFTYHQGATLVAAARTLVVDLGAGNDEFHWLNTGGDVTAGSRVGLDVTAGAGADRGTIAFDRVADSVVSVSTDWGTGADVSTLAVGAFAAGAVDVATDLGGGTNSYAAAFDVIGGGDTALLDVAVVGGGQADAVSVAFQNYVAHGSRAGVVADLGAGNDTFAVAFKRGGFLVFDNSQVTVAARGGLGNDTLSAGTTGSGLCQVVSGGLLSVALDGGAGRDTVGVDFSAEDAWYLEAGTTMQLRLSGGTGGDTLSCLLANTFAAAGRYDVAVRAGTGDDRVSFDLPEPGGMTFGPVGGVLLDGGGGTDTSINFNPSVTFEAGFEEFE